MKKLLLSLAMLFPLQAIAADDSVYTWGAWSQGIQPAAGVAHAAIPAPIQTPNTSFRPNEHSAFERISFDTARQRLAATTFSSLAAIATANGSTLVSGSQVVVTTPEQANRR